MKRFLFAALLIVLWSGLAAAQPSRASLHLRLSDRSPISVQVDGRYYDRGTSLLTLDGLRPGPHRVSVFAAGGYNTRPARIYTGTIRLAPGTENFATVDVQRRTLRLQTDMPGHDYDNADRYANRNSDGNSNGGNEGGPIGKFDARPDGFNDEGNRSNNSNNDNNGAGSSVDEGYGSFPNGRGAGNAGSERNSRSLGALLTDADMDDLRSRVTGRITDTDKEQLLKNVLDNRAATTAQVRQMLSWLSFDSTRLAFAKWAYTHATDPKNYWKLEDAFSFSATKEEFSKSISGR